LKDVSRPGGVFLYNENVDWGPVFAPSLCLFFQELLMHREIVRLETTAACQLVDVTESLRAIAGAFPEAALMAIYARGATAAVMIQENWDPDIQLDILDALSKVFPSGCWRHDRIDGNADAHIKAGVVGPSETIPLENGQMLLSTWQNVFFCDFDGPRADRELIVTLLP
jgi:secondary thiamine-phosphate synthase enzyme